MQHTERFLEAQLSIQLSHFLIFQTRAHLQKLRGTLECRSTHILWNTGLKACTEFLEILRNEIFLDCSIFIKQIWYLTSWVFWMFLSSAVVDVYLKMTKKTLNKANPANRDQLCNIKVFTYFQVSADIIFSDVTSWFFFSNIKVHSAPNDVMMISQKIQSTPKIKPANPTSNIQKSTKTFYRKFNKLLKVKKSFDQKVIENLKTRRILAWR